MYHATYLLNGGTNGANPSTYTIETDVIILQDATVLATPLEAWYANAEFSGEAITQKPKGFTGDIDLYAKWTIITYTITYNLNEGDK